MRTEDLKDILKVNEMESHASSEQDDEDGEPPEPLKIKSGNP